MNSIKSHFNTKSNKKSIFPLNCNLTACAHRWSVWGNRLISDGRLVAGMWADFACVCPPRRVTVWKQNRPIACPWAAGTGSSDGGCSSGGREDFSPSSSSRIDFWSIDCWDRSRALRPLVLVRIDAWRSIILSLRHFSSPGRAGKWYYGDYSFEGVMNWNKSNECTKNHGMLLGQKFKFDVLSYFHGLGINKREKVSNSQLWVY